MKRRTCFRRFSGRTASALRGEIMALLSMSQSDANAYVDRDGMHAHRIGLGRWQCEDGSEQVDVIGGASCNMMMN